MTRAAAGDPWGADVSYPTARSRRAHPPRRTSTGYRTPGPNWPYDPTWTKGSSAGFVSDVDAQGDRFDPNKLLFDPYGREMSHDPLEPAQTSSSPFLTGATNRASDDGQVAPKALAMPADTTTTGTPPARALKDDVIYEVHVRGLTMNDPSVPAALRGDVCRRGAEGESAMPRRGGLPRSSSCRSTRHRTTPTTPRRRARTTGDTRPASLLRASGSAPTASDQTLPGRPTREVKAMVAALPYPGHQGAPRRGVQPHGRRRRLRIEPGRRQDPLLPRARQRGLLRARGGSIPTPVDDTCRHGRQLQHRKRGRARSRRRLAHLLGGRDEIDGFRFDLAAVLGNSCTAAPVMRLRRAIRAASWRGP